MVYNNFISLNMIVSIFLCLLTGLTYFAYRIFRVPDQLSHIPSIPGIKWFLNGFKDEPSDVKAEQMRDTQLRKTKIMLMWRFGRWGVLLSSKNAFKQAFENTKAIPKRILAETNPDGLFSQFMGINLVFSNHEVWKKHRTVLNAPFKKQFEVSLFSDCVKNFFEVVDSKFKGLDIDIYTYMQRITIDALGKGIMGVDFNSIQKDSVPFISDYNDVLKHGMRPLYLIFRFLESPWNPFRRPHFNSLNRLDTYFKSVLEVKKKEYQLLVKQGKDLDANSDILSLMIKAAKSEDVEFGDKEIRDNVMIFILAGHDTTAFAISSALHFLAQNPEVQDKARQEVLKVMNLKQLPAKEIESLPIPSAEQLKNLEYLMAIMKEALRLYPSITELPPRFSKKEIEIDGYIIPAKTDLTFDIRAMQRDPDYWHKPGEFIPERFIKESPDYEANFHDVDPITWSPFGGGARSCIGKAFSIMEQKTVLAMILLRYQITYPKGTPQAGGAPFKLSSSFFLSPDNFKLDFKTLV